MQYWYENDRWNQYKCFQEPSEEEWAAAEEKRKYVEECIDRYERESYELQENVCYDTPIRLQLTKHIYRTFVFKSVLDDYWFEFAEAGDLERYFSKHVCPLDSVLYYEGMAFDEEEYKRQAESMGEALPPWRGGLPEDWQDVDEYDSNLWDICRKRDELSDETLPDYVMKSIVIRHFMYWKFLKLMRKNWKHIDNKFDIGDHGHDRYHVTKPLWEKLSYMQDKSRKKPFNPDLTELERDILEEIRLLEWEERKREYFPVEMPDRQIMQAIREAYDSAAKVEHKTYRVRMDIERGEIELPEQGSILYEGRAKNGLVIAFYFHHASGRIEAAYPVYGKHGKKEKVSKGG